MGDLSFRRGRIEGMEHRAGSQLITAVAPLAEMLGYAAHMRSITQGRAEYSMQFTTIKRLLAPASLELMKPVLPPTDPKVQNKEWLRCCQAGRGIRVIASKGVIDR
jgi:hypothetical protein